MTTGRFAPTPSGPLHVGSVVAAVGSWLDARAVGGRWLLRIDDLDPPRVQAGATDAILRALAALELGWDGEVVYQSQRGSAYRDALDSLRDAGHLFGCRCTRSQLGRGPYPGSCRGRPPSAGLATRLLVRDVAIVVDDALQGRHVENLAQSCGDFVVCRADGVPAYHLATVVDDAAAGVDRVVRGADLLDSTPRQIWLQRLLGLPTPAYAHLPVVLDAAGQKLSKQTLAPTFRPDEAAEMLCRALRFLGLSIPSDAQGARPADLLAWALPHWSLSHIEPRSRQGAWDVTDEGLAGADSPSPGADAPTSPALRER